MLREKMMEGLIFLVNKMGRMRKTGNRISIRDLCSSIINE